MSCCKIGRLFDCRETMDQEPTLSVLDLPDSLLLKVLMSLPLESVGCVSLTCSRFNCIAQDEQLWKALFQQDFGVAKSVALRPLACSWRGEYRRLYDETPAVLCEEVSSHEDEAWHVSFSHDGTMFATTSVDATVKVWKASTPCKLRFTANLQAQFGWNNTQFSQFNQSDTLLLVSGYRTLFGEGEIVVFDLKGEFRVLNRLFMNPFTVFGTWWDDSHLLTGATPTRNHLGPVSCLWLAKATREVASERKYAMINPFRFRGSKLLKVTDVPAALDESSSSCDKTFECGHTFNSDEAFPLSSRCAQNFSREEAFALPNERGHDVSSDDEFTLASEYGHNVSSDEIFTLASEYGRDVRSDEASTLASRCGHPLLSADSTETPAKYGADRTTTNSGSTLVGAEPTGSLFCNHQVRNTSPQARTGATQIPATSRVEKLLIFTQGDICDVPQYVCIKGTREEEIEEEEKAKEGLQWPEEEDGCLRSYEAGGSGCMTSVDHKFDMHGQIIGMALSPDNRYLYVNTRSWRKDHETQDMGEPPLISNDIDIHVIDLVTFTRVDAVLTSHKAYSPNIRCAFVYLDVNELCVVSGAENDQGYMWDRHYGVHVRCFPHEKCVNCCAFNPADPEMLVTVSDDHKIKIWRSRRQMRESPSFEGLH